MKRRAKARAAKREHAANLREVRTACSAKTDDGRACRLGEGHKRDHRFDGIAGETCTCMLRWYPNRCKAHPECNQ